MGWKCEGGGKSYLVFERKKREKGEVGEIAAAGGDLMKKGEVGEKAPSASRQSLCSWLSRKKIRIGKKKSSAFKDGCSALERRL